MPTGTDITVRHKLAGTDEPGGNLELPEIVRRYAAGESVQTIAAGAGVHRATLYRWMLAGTGDRQYHELVTHCLVQRVAEADEALRSAKDPCDIARAREMARFARMDLERRRPHLYGPRQEITHSAGVPTLRITIVKAEPPTLPGEREVVSSPPALVAP